MRNGSCKLCLPRSPSRSSVDGQRPKQLYPALKHLCCGVFKMRNPQTKRHCFGILATTASILLPMGTSVFCRMTNLTDGSSYSPLRERFWHDVWGPNSENSIEQSYQKTRLAIGFLRKIGVSGMSGLGCAPVAAERPTWARSRPAEVQFLKDQFRRLLPVRAPHCFCPEPLESGPSAVSKLTSEPVVRSGRV